MNHSPGVSPEPHGELFEWLLQTAFVRIARSVSRGHASPSKFWYDQPGHEGRRVGGDRRRFGSRHTFPDVNI
jgi:hypothetical protein